MSKKELMREWEEAVMAKPLIDLFWVRAYAPFYEHKDRDYDRSGKWLLFIPNNKEQFSLHWDKIETATLEGKLGIAAKITNPELERESLVICVYTKDYADIEDVKMVRESLRNLGYTKILPYKPDYETLKGKYGSDTVLYRM